VKGSYCYWALDLLVGRLFLCSKWFQSINRDILKACRESHIQWNTSGTEPEGICGSTREIPTTTLGPLPGQGAIRTTNLGRASHPLEMRAVVRTSENRAKS
jgi:hypothetical protein